MSTRAHTLWYGCGAFARRCANATGDILQSTPEDALERRLVAFQEVCERIVSENTFSQYVYKTVPASNHLWAFKKTLCTHTALSGARARLCVVFACVRALVFACV